ncbi:MAG: hypothetical protein AB1641_08040 [Thermodesulfobacteriota bacterium]
MNTDLNAENDDRRNRPFEDWKKGLGRLIMALALLFLPQVLHPDTSWAVMAQVFFQDKTQPLNIAETRFHYGDMQLGIEEIIIMFQGSRQFVGYNFKQVRRLEILELQGERKSFPVYLVTLSLKEPGREIKGRLMPLRRITGIYQGRPWKLELNLQEDDTAANAESLKEIRFLEVGQ